MLEFGLQVQQIKVKDTRVFASTGRRHLTLQLDDSSVKRNSQPQ